VSIHLGATIFKKFTGGFKMRANGCGVACRGRLRGSGQALADARRVLMEHKDGKDISEDHAHQNHAETGER